MRDNFGIGAFLIVLIIIIQSIVGSYFSQKNIKYFHQTGISLVLGIAASAFAYYCFDYQAQLQQESFIYIFLPAIIFSEGYSLKKKLFFKNMSYILIYGFLGTLVTFTFLAISMEFLCDNNLIIIERGNTRIDDGELVRTTMQLNTKEIILFSASLSSKDTFMATNMVNYEIYPNLFHIIFGEGILNDATSVILYQSFDSLILQGYDFDFQTIPNVFLVFVLSIVICIVVGSIFGALCSLILKHMKFLNLTVIHEILVVFMCCYLGYCVTSFINLSGLISLLFSGFVFSYYGFHNLSDKAKICANVAFQTISSGAENFLFAYVGFTTFSFYKNAWSFSLIGWIVLILIISRIFQVFFISAICSIFYRKNTFIVKFREQTIICFTGISRGILGFILMDSVQTEQYKDLLNSTMVGVLIITTLLFGLINPKLIDCVLKNSLKKKEIDKNNKQDQDIENQENKSENIDNQEQISVNTIDIINDKIKSSELNQKNEALEQRQQKSESDYYTRKRQKIEDLLNDIYNEKIFPSKLQFKLSRFNEKYIKPFLIRDYKSKLDEFIISNLLLKETKMQLLKPANKNRNSIFITNGLQKLKTVINTTQLKNVQFDDINFEKGSKIKQCIFLKKESKENKESQQCSKQLENINLSKKQSKTISTIKKEQEQQVYIKLQQNPLNQTELSNECNDEVLENSKKCDQKQ